MTPPKGFFPVGSFWIGSVVEEDRFARGTVVFCRRRGTEQVRAWILTKVDALAYFAFKAAVTIMQIPSVSKH